MAETLQYKQPHMLRHDFEILREEKPVGAVSYEGISHRLAHAHFDGTAIQIKQDGLLRTEVTVTAADSGETMGVYREPMLGRTGKLAIGDTEYTFGRVGKKIALKSSYAWKNTDGNELITYHVKGIVRNVGEIAVSDAALALPDSSLLILLGLFNCLHREEGDASAAGA
ncbi:MAG TPA: hypothetical protein VF572_03570 [Candidatus Saccharimonadales bacterium]|jgi:hypothetical protein